MSNRSPPLPLQTKVSLMLAVLIGVYIAASYVILRQVIVPAFDELELSAAKSDLKRAEMALRTDLDNLEATTADWAPWDDIYAYVLGKNPGFQRSNLTRPTLVNLGLDFVAVYAFDDHLMWAQLLAEIKLPSDLSSKVRRELGALKTNKAALHHMDRGVCWNG